MKARPLRLLENGNYEPCEVHEATHVELSLLGPFPTRFIPVILKGKREGTRCWSWNGDTEKPTLKPSILTKSTYHDESSLLPEEFGPWEDHPTIQGCKQRFPKPEFAHKLKKITTICHTWVNDGMVQYLEDSTHEFAGKTLPLLELEP